MQVVKDADNRKVGEIKTDWSGSRIITDSNGEKMGTIEKNIWGETVVRRERNYEGTLAGYGDDTGSDKGETCPECGAYIDPEDEMCIECEEEYEEDDE